MISFPKRVLTIISPTPVHGSGAAASPSVCGRGTPRIGGAPLGGGGGGGPRDGGAPAVLCVGGGGEVLLVLTRLGSSSRGGAPSVVSESESESESPPLRQLTVDPANEYKIVKKYLFKPMIL